MTFGDGRYNTPRLVAVERHRLRPRSTNGRPRCGRTLIVAPQQAAQTKVCRRCCVRVRRLLTAKGLLLPIAASLHDAAYLVEVVFQKHLQAASVASLCAHDRRSRIPGPFHITGADTPHGERAQCLRAGSCHVRERLSGTLLLTGGTRANPREVAQNWLYWMSSPVATSEWCTSRDRVLGLRPMRARTRDDSSVQPGDLKGTKGTLR